MSSISDCRRLVLATTNAHKLRELRSLLASLEVTLVGMHDVASGLPEATETGSCLSENARLKAAHYARCLSAWVLSDDTGLGVDSLNGAPGVRSARYAGEGATMVENRAKLLADLQAFGPNDRSARFVCCLALAAPHGHIVLEARGTCCGRIRMQASGSGGFGYDDLFEVDGIGRTLAELDAAETALVGHRAEAARRFIDAWRQAKVA